MTKFKELDKRSAYEVEQDILKSWGGINKINEAQIENRKDNKTFVFYDGPAFANGFPGLHHMVSKNLKDIVCKYHVMKGEKVIRKVGWDTHGLPIENHVEKKLGISSKKDVEAMGVEKFNDECRKSVRENEAAFTDLTSKMGQFIDTNNPYLTFKNEYIETEWWILKQFYEKGMFYEGTRIVPYCPHCGTGLASHEVAQNYQEDDTDTVYVPFKVNGEENTYFLAWTTTPWTLLANVALCVNPDMVYVKVNSRGTNFIMAKDLVSSVLGDEVEVLDSFRGKELEFKEFEQLIPEVEAPANAFKVLCDDYVSADDGTGVVHIAPAFGEDDKRVCDTYGIEGINPVGKDGCYTEGPWKDMFVFDANEEVIKYLKENDKLLKKQRIKHDYPHCWRCDTPLLYYSMPSYYVKVSAFKDELVKANSKVNWYPDYVGEKRFANWLENAKDWNVSRTRYWGSPIPYFTCECGHTEMLGSIAELKEKAIEEISDDFDLHKPYIDNVHLKCPKCGKPMNRIPDVLDCWFDSGSMPFAQYHYPFENKEFWKTQFPADFICEGIDQTRGWFYTLLVISTFITGKAPFKNVLVNDLLLDAEGKKMSKSRGNIVEPFTTIEEYGADTVRFYLPYVSPVWTPLKFDIEGLKEVYSKFFNPLKNTYSFFTMYANIDGVSIEDCKEKFKVDYKDLEEIDKWILSKYNKLVLNVTDSFEEYDLNKVVRFLASFVSEDLSNWYIRRNRDRFWGSKLDNSKKSVYQTTYEVLLGLSKLIAPIVPYLSEEMYRGLTDGESVHLEDYPKVDKKMINDKIEEKMDLVRNLISLGRNAREEVKIKVRQPISQAILDGKSKKILGEAVELIKEELNVKEVLFEDDLSVYMTFEVKPNFKVCGKLFGSSIKEFQTKLMSLTDDEIKSLRNGNSIVMDIDDKNISITPEMVDVRINAKEGFDAAYMGNDFIILNTNLTEDLIHEGIVRELISKVQQLRKTRDYNVVDRITLYYDSNEEVDKCISEYKDYIMKETLSNDIVKESGLVEEIDLNGHKCFIDIKR